MFERFTDNARRVVVLAQEESRLLNHDRIGTEHLLLGLLREDDTPTAHALAGAGVSLVTVQRRLEQSPGRGKHEPSGHIPFTDRTKNVLELALRVSQRLGGERIGAPHLLRALLEVPDCTGYALLVGLDVDVDALATVADDLARNDTEPRRETNANIRAEMRSVRASSLAGAAAVARRMSAHEISSSVADLATELAERHDRLAAGLRHYGRHLASCAPDSARGCTCGLDPLLADTEPPQAPAAP